MAQIYIAVGLGSMQTPVPEVRLAGLATANWIQLSGNSHQHCNSVALWSKTYILPLTVVGRNPSQGCLSKRIQDITKTSINPANR